MYQKLEIFGTQWKSPISIVLRRLSLLFMIMIMSLVSANAVTELTSCGQNSGWLDNETYLINFSDVSSFYANTYCFQLSDNNYNNIVFRQITNQINISKAGVFTMFEYLDSTTSVYNYDNLTYENFNVIDGTNENNKIFIDTTSSASGISTSLNNNFNNMVLKGFKIFYESGTGGWVGKLHDLNNVSFYSLRNLVTGDSFRNSKINDSFIDIRGSGSALFINAIAGTGNNLFYNSVIKINSPADTIFYNLANGNTYTNSLLSEFRHTDTNNDNIGDSPLDANIINPKIFVNLFGKHYIQDFNEGLDLSTINNLANGLILPINIINLTAVDSIGMGSMSKTGIDFSYANMQLTQSLEILMFTDNYLSCEIKIFSPGEVCGLTSSSTTALGQQYNSHISINRDSSIYNLSFDDSSSTGDNRLIANHDDTQQSNISISSDIFSLDDFNSDYTSTKGEEVIKLFSSSSKINNNIFSIGGGNNENKTLIDFKSTNSNSNSIYNNSFNDLRAPSTGKMYIFNLNGNTNFYNNFLGSEVEVSRISLAGLNTSPRINYLHSNGNIYTYHIGNFYTDNSGCVDGNSDGICDSSYVSGTTTDFRPLAVYPFDFEGNILFAEQVITNTSIVVDLLTPIDLQTFNLVDTSSTINISFTQTSQFNDLTCDYIVDGSSISTITNVASGVQNSVLVNSWTTANHTIRAECFNEFSFDASTEITIETLLASEGAGTGGTPGDGEADLNLDSGSEIIDLSSPSNSVDNILGFIGNISAFLFNILIPALILIVIIGAFIFMVVLVK